MAELLDVARQMALALHDTTCGCRGCWKLCARCSALQWWTWWLQDQTDVEAVTVRAQEAFR
jgi:hypothetical protein